MTPEQIQAYRELFLTLCDYACNSDKGRDELDPVYKLVTENRDGPGEKARQKYSSCADLPFFVWFRLGLRCDFINRAEHHGWKVGVNLNRWCPKPIGPNPYGRVPKQGESMPQAGDVIVINNSWGGHVMCVRGFDASPDRIFTAEYGQPGGKLGSRALSFTKAGNWVIGAAKNPVMSLVSLEKALMTEKLAEPDIDCLKDWQATEALISLKERIAWGT